MELTHIDSSNFEETISGGNRVLVDFFATWCGPCKFMAPVLEDIAEELPENQKIVKFDIDLGPEIAEKHLITAVPTMIMFENGQEIGRLIGVCSEDAILDLFAKA